MSRELHLELPDRTIQSHNNHLVDPQIKHPEAFKKLKVDNVSFLALRVVIDYIVTKILVIKLKLTIIISHNTSAGLENTKSRIQNIMTFK